MPNIPKLGIVCFRASTTQRDEVMVTKLRRAAAPKKWRLTKAARAKAKAVARSRSQLRTESATITPAEITALRYRLKVSQRVFAELLHTKLKTLQNWEQGQAKPNAQAIALIKLVSRKPALLDDLARLDTSEPLLEPAEYEHQMATMNLIGVQYRDTLKELAK